MRAVHESGPLLRRLLRLDGKPVPWRKRLTFIAGVGLIAASFLVYLAYPLIFLLASGSAIAKVVMAAGAWVLSWTSFTGGLLLAGLGQSKHFKYLKYFSRRKGSSTGPSTLKDKKPAHVAEDSSTLN